MKILIALLLIHGSLHLLGFVQAFFPALVPQLKGSPLIALSVGMVPWVGVAWLMAACTLITAAGLCLWRVSAFWVVAAIGVTLSQALIVLMWRDAWAGSLPNLLIVPFLLVAAMSARFQQRVDGEVRALLSPTTGAAAGSRDRVEAAELAALPPPVRRWLEVAGVVGKARTSAVRLQQRGALRTAPDKKFMPYQAEQYFSVDEPGFIWRVKARMMGLPILGRDAYVGGEGRMLILAAGLLPVADAAGHKVDQGALLRYLGEMVWFPSAVLGPKLTWEAINGRSARATLRHGGVSGSALFSFNESGRVDGMSAERYRGADPAAALTPWSIAISAWRVFEGVEVPSQGDVIWKLPAGDFSYFRWEIVDLQHNRPQLYDGAWAR